MKSLFINTSSFFMSIAILEDDKILYKEEAEYLTDMASSIVPTIKLSFEKVPFELNEIDKIFIVNGPGSFTGVRVGVTAAKTIAWALKKDLIPISSLELLGTTKVDTENVISLIDARRGYVFAGVYDQNLNAIMQDKYILLADLKKYLKNGTMVSYDKIDGAIFPKIDIPKIIMKHKEDPSINPHSLKPNYLKLTEAEEKKKENG